MLILRIVGVDSDSILFNHRSYQKPDLFSSAFLVVSRKIRIPGFRMEIEATLN